MSENRINELFKFLEDEPNDHFLIYAIATEYLKVDKEKALDFFQILLSNHEEYIATYYHAGNLLSELGYKKKAEETFIKGMEICKKHEKHHAFKELKNAYQNFLFEDND